jgi:hypothetical protein
MERFGLKIATTPDCQGEKQQLFKSANKDKIIYSPIAGFVFLVFGEETPTKACFFR